MCVPERIYDRLKRMYQNQELPPDELEIVGELLSYLCCYDLDCEKLMEGENSDDEEDVNVSLAKAKN